VLPHQVQKKGDEKEMSFYEHLSLLYVEKNAKQGDTPEKLLSLYREAYEKIVQCDKEHKGKAFPLE
jgi:hypothetical protein